MQNTLLFKFMEAISNDQKFSGRNKNLLLKTFHVIIEDNQNIFKIMNLYVHFTN